MPSCRRLVTIALAALMLTAPGATAQSLDEAVVRLNGAPIVRLTGTAAERACGYRRHGVVLGVAERALTNTAARATDVLTDPAPSVRVRDLGPSDILLELRFWTDSRRSDLLATTSLMRRQSVEALRAAGVPLPEPDVRRVTLITRDLSSME